MITLAQVFIRFLTTVLTSKTPFKGKVPWPCVGEDSSSPIASDGCCHYLPVTRQFLLDNIQWGVTFLADGLTPKLQMTYQCFGVILVFHMDYFRNITVTREIPRYSKQEQQDAIHLAIKPLESYLSECFNEVIAGLFKDIPIPECVCLATNFNPAIVLNVDDLIVQDGQQSQLESQ